MTKLEIILTIALAVIVLSICLYFYFRPQYHYYEAEIMVVESNFGDVLKFYTKESSGYTLRKLKKNNQWQVARRTWRKRFGNYYCKFKWRSLLEPHLSLVQQRLKQGEKIILSFD